MKTEWSEGFHVKKGDLCLVRVVLARTVARSPEAQESEHS